jgi:Na+/proline symporter
MHPADIIIFVVFLAINLIVGALARRKKQTFREFVVGDKNFSTVTLVATMLATSASGSTFFTTPLLEERKLLVKP